MQKTFRLGATSYVYPADLIANARQLAGVVDDMELVLFETDGYGSNFPSRDTVAALNEIAARHDLTYTVHLPNDVNLHTARWRDQNQRAIELTRALHPYAYVLHLDGRALLRDASAENVTRWQADMQRALQETTTWIGDATRVCVENVEAWDPTYFESIVEALDVKRCIDIGHLWLKRRDPLPFLDAHGARTRVIHLHGVHTRDHASLAHVPEAQLRAVLETLGARNYAGVVTLEVFGTADFESSRERLARVLERTLPLKSKR